MPTKFRSSKINLRACCGMTSWDVTNSALFLTVTFCYQGSNDLNLTRVSSVTRLTNLHKNALEGKVIVPTNF